MMETNITIRCRACLGEDEEMHYLFNIFDQAVTLQEIFTSTTKFEIAEDDGLSPYLCPNCTRVIVDFYNLKIIYEENKQHVRSFIIVDNNDNDCFEPEDQVNLEGAASENVEEDYITIKVENNNSDEMKQELESQVSTYTCPECNECFIHKEEIQNHMLCKHEITVLQFEVELDTKEEFESGEDSHSDRKVNMCIICGACFAKRVYLKEHMESHSSEKKYICNFCNKAFKRRTVLVKHRRIHTNPREWICEVCGKAFNDKGTLRTHISLLHIGERKFSCPICGLKFPLKCTMEKHVRRHHHNKEREFFCSDCPLAYKDKCSLNRHMLVKHSQNNTKIKCEECDKEYTTASNMFKHKRICHGVLGSPGIRQ